MLFFYWIICFGCECVDWLGNSLTFKRVDIEFFAYCWFELFFFFFDWVLIMLCLVMNKKVRLWEGKTILWFHIRVWIFFAQLSWMIVWVFVWFCCRVFLLKIARGNLIRFQISFFFSFVLVNSNYDLKIGWINVGFRYMD